MSRDLVSRILASLAGIGLSLFILEGGVRLHEHLSTPKRIRAEVPTASKAVIPSTDPELIFELNPDWSDGEFSVNSHGMADEEFPVAKAPEEFRIAFVGDSISCGLRLRRREEIYLFLLEESANAEHTNEARIRCLNFGVNGYGILQSVRMAQSRVLPFDADVLVAQLCLNDPFPSGGLIGPRGPEWTAHSARLFLRAFWPRRFWAHQLVERVWNLEGRERMARGLRELAELSNGGTPVLVVLFPYLDQAAYRSWGFGSLHEEIRRICLLNRLPFLDLYRPFDEAGLIEDRWPMDPLHPGPKGHRIAAESITSVLAKSGRLP